MARIHAKRQWFGVAVIWSALLGGLAAPVLAQPRQTPQVEPAPPANETPEPSNVSNDTPWSQGVSPAAKATAQALLEEGNALFVRGKHQDALAKYQEAIASWDHPAIRFNIVRVLINLDKPILALENLDLALRYGSDPLEDQVFAEAQNYLSLLKGRISTIEVSCEQQGPTVTLDGRPLLSCPGTQSVRVLAGEHHLTAEHTDFLPQTKTVIAAGGAAAKVALHLLTLDEASVKERRWPVWKPWAVVAAGVMTTGLGALFLMKSQSDLDQYASDLEFHCADRGCEPAALPPSTQDLKSRAVFENRAGMTTVVIGSLGIIAGVSLAILNRERAVIRRPDPRVVTTGLSPLVNRELVGLGYQASF